MWIFYKDALVKMNLRSDGMAFSEEIKIEALCNPAIGFKEIPINFSNRAGEIKLRPWRDGWNNLLFLFRKRFQLRLLGYQLLGGLRRGSVSVDHR
jgi:hypothetical protein